MSYFLIAVAVVALLLAAFKAVTAADPAVIALWAKRIIAGVLGGFAALMFFTGKVPFALMLATFAMMILRRGGGGFGWRLGGKPSAGNSSAVETDLFSMKLDHDSGEMDGDIKSGTHAGHRLSDLSKYDLLSMLEKLKFSDQQSAAVLVSYLDRRFGTDWQDDMPDQNTSGPSSDGPMSRDRALEILGLTREATSTEILKAHRELMHKLHPDHGGSGYLASRINAARDYLMGS